MKAKRRPRRATVAGQAAEALQLVEAQAPAQGAVRVVLETVFFLLAEARGLLAPGRLPAELEPLHVGLDASAVRELMSLLTMVEGTPVPYATLEIERLGTVYEALVAPDARRMAGSHYTPPSLTEPIVERTLAPLLARSPDLLALRVCDPAMGSGAFLLAAHRVLSRRARGAPGPAARRQVAVCCLRGVDRDPWAVELARRSLWLEVADPAAPLDFLDHALLEGDSLLDFPHERLGAIDAFVGNPPWVSYAGRAAQPLDDGVRQAYLARYTSFAGYRNLQGLFIERCATLLEPGGRLGLVVPSSMSEQHGYVPTRQAHDRLCACDPQLEDLGNDAFEGVFQPCMALISTRREHTLDDVPGSTWPVERRDLDDDSARLLARLTRGPSLPAHLFGERGVQTSGEDVARMSPTPTVRHHLALRAGGDIQPFLRRAPSFHCDPTQLTARLRPAAEWSAVRLLVRQTARYPMAVLGDGKAFRNSILAGFADAEHPAAFLVAWLNSTPVRWVHYMRHRDARQGMPQLKIGHLRVTPAPPQRDGLASIAELGERLSASNVGIDAAGQAELDTRVGDALALTAAERARIATWQRLGL